MTAQMLPAVVRDVELSRPIPAIAATGADGRRIERAWLLVRLCTEPLGSILVTVPDAGLSAADLVTAIEAELGVEVRAAITAAGGDAGAGIPHGGVAVPDLPPFLAERATVLRSAPPITAVICTRERPDALRACLDSLIAQVYPSLRILVVDNAPTTDATERVVRAAAARGHIEYLVEPAPGLSRARNRAVAASPGEILAWIDDDEVADPYWIVEVARALARHPEADVISGVIVPAELETPAQLWFEQFGGHSKGRGYTPAVFSPASASVQSPLYPLPPFATGANMTFRPGVIERIGGFDAALGAGTPAMGSEDTLAFTKVLVGGGTIVYQPSAITRHYHRRDLAGLRRQMVGYGRGLTAAYTSLVLGNPRVLLPLIRLVPTALRDIFGADGARTATVQADFPAELLKVNRRAMATGPFAYLWGRMRGARRVQLVGGRT
ncbi:MAG TPA: glycosyltransferase [Micromonosporaceae bacterium]|nr:glycosyltransferase [Micromonosporaceae bacterium]